jgi:precorrin-6A synthase
MALNEVGRPVTVTTGRLLRESGFPEGVDTVAVMLDGECSFQTLDPEGIEIWWGAYVGMAQEAILSGPLADLSDRIVETRRVAPHPPRLDHGHLPFAPAVRGRCRSPAR